MKKILIYIILAILAFNLTACGGDSEYVFIINDEEITMRDVDVFGFIYTMEHSLVSMDELDNIYDAGQTYEQHYKEELENDIIMTVLLNKEAYAHGTGFDAEMRSKAESETDALLEKFGEERLKGRNIKRADVLRVYEWKVSGDAYADMKGEESNVSDEGGTENDDRYIKVFQVLFPTAELNADGMVSTDADGNILKVSNEDASTMRESAEKFSDALKAGGDMDELLRDCPASVTGAERILKYEDLSMEYKGAVNSLSIGDVSGVIESSYGYYVVRLLGNNEEEHGQLISDYEAKLEINDTKEKLFDELYRKYIGNNNEYRNNDQWKLVMIDNYY